MTDILVSFINLIANLFDSVMPSLSVDSGSLSQIVTALESVVEFMAQVNFIVPLPTIFTVTAIVYGFRLTKFMIFVVNWVIRRIADVIP